MSEWWTYRLDSFLLFSARTYYRLLETYNAQLWPMQWLALGAGAVMLMALGRERAWLRDHAVFGLLAFAWAWVAWGFLHARFAAINWAADYAAWLFAAQAAALAWVGVLRGGVVFRRDAAAGDPLAIAMIAVGLVYPLAGAALGRPWSQTAVFGLMPEPTVIATVGFLMLAEPLPRWLFAVPVLASLAGAALLAALRAGEAWLCVMAAAAALLAMVWRRRRRA